MKASGLEIRLDPDAEMPAYNPADWHVDWDRMWVHDRANRCIFRIDIDDVPRSETNAIGYMIARPINVRRRKPVFSPDELTERGRMAIAAFVAFGASLVSDEDFYQLDESGDEIDEIPF
jgi:hypothetical protein